MACVQGRRVSFTRRACTGREPHARGLTCNRYLHIAQARSATKSVVSELLDVCAECDRGRQTSDSQRSSILQCVERLAAAQEDHRTNGSSLSACWKLIWATERVCVYTYSLAVKAPVPSAL
jgi:PAP_fibrillin